MTAIAEEPATLDAEFAAYAHTGLGFVELHRWNCTRDERSGSSFKVLGKVPIHKGWIDKAVKYSEAFEHLSDGQNVGVRVQNGLAILDIDPRNYGAEDRDVFQELQTNLGLDFSAYPKVRSGGGGWHVYMLINADQKTSQQVPQYPGIELKRSGQVVAAGSRHPDGDFYVWERSIADFETVPVAEPRLVAAFQKVSKPANAKAQEGEEDFGKFADQPEVLMGLIDEHLNPEDFSNHDDWFNFMCSVHWLTGGMAAAEFAVWSIRDTRYVEDYDLILERFSSLSLSGGAGTPIRGGLVFKKLLEAGARFDELPRKDGELVLSKGDPRRSARLFLQHCASESGIATLRCFDGDFFQYRLGKYEFADQLALEEMVSQFLERQKVLDRRVKSHDTETALKPFRPMDKDVREVMRALKRMTSIDARDFDLPCFLDDGSERFPEARQVIPCRNGILDVSSGDLLPHTPLFFSTSCLKFDYDPDAPLPFHLHKLLDDMFGDDKEAIEAVQMMMGLCLSADTSHQVIFNIVGPPGSGKGTLGSVLEGLLGSANVLSTTITALSERFGLERAIGKSVIILPDAHVTDSSDKRRAVERMKLISGEDRLSIDRKNKAAWEGRLPARIVSITNSPIVLPDPSGSLDRRYVLIRVSNAFHGERDFALRSKLEAEMTSILNWAIEGYRKLRERGAFPRPSSGLELQRQIVNTAAPVRQFITERCVLDANGRVCRDELFRAWCAWVAENNRLNTLRDRDHFLTEVQGQFGLSQKRLRYDGASDSDDNRRMCIDGLSLKSARIIQIDAA